MTRDIKLEKEMESYSEKATSSTKRRITKAMMAGFGAAAAGGLMSPAQADADVVYTFFNGTVNTSTGLGAFQGFNLDIDGDLTNEMFIGINAATSLGNPTFIAFRGYQFSGAGSVQGTGLNFIPFTYAPSGGSFAPGAGGLTVGNFWMGWNYASQTGASFNPLGVGTQPSTHIIGGTTSSGFAYWLRLELTNDGANTPQTMRVVDFAFDNMGNAIHAGDMGVIPEPSGALALLALAGGATAIRRRRKSAA